MAATQIRGNTQIIAGSIVDAQINSAAAIASSKLADGANFLKKDGSVTPTADQPLGGFKITNLGTPTASTDAATKGYVDAGAQGLDVKASVRAASTANLTLSATQTVDGVALSANDRILVKNQTTGSDNGIYLVSAGAWTRTTDADISAEVTSGMYTFVEEGTTQASQGWLLTTTGAITLGTTALVFTQFTGTGEITAGTGLSKTGNTLSIDATVATLTGSQTFTNKSIVATQLTGTLQAGQFPALTGDITTSAGSLATALAAASVTLSKLANLAANSVIGNSTGSSATPTAVPLAAAATASAIVLRDSSANMKANNSLLAASTTATAAGTTTLTAASAYTQQFTGSTTQTVVLPDATTLAVGFSFRIANRSSGVVTVNANGGGLIQTMAPGTQLEVTAITIGTTAGTWDAAYSSTTAGTGSVTSVSVVSANGFAGSVATATTTPAITVSTSITGVLKGNGTAISAASAGTDYIAPSSVITRETPSGAVNSSNTTYTLANTPIAGTEQVFLNGILQEPSAGNDYTISGATITYLTAPATGDRLRVTYLK